ncbi:MAG: hypothetical protein IKW62_05675, partial [Clostridia bacterium]|nr:hypothetical protein [Clostridia bacterium]
NISFSYCSQLTSESVESIVAALSGTSADKTLTLPVETKVTYYNAHSTEYANEDTAWNAFVSTKPNWTIALS